MPITVDARYGAAQAGSGRRAAPESERRARAFRRARRHSLLVKTLRLAFPITAAGMAAFYALTLGASWQLGSGRLKVGEVQLTADDLTMKNPSYFGLTKDGGRYEVRAKKAIVEFNRDAPIKLIDIDGDIVQANSVTTRLKAKHGLLDNAKSELELFDGIEIEGSNGLKARLQRAKVFSKEHRVVSKDPVDVLMPTGRVRGSTMTLRTDTKESTFVGNVTVNLTPTSQPGASPATPAFGADSRQPVDVASDQLYVNDTAKTALFMGNVVATQGESMLKAPELHIAYEGGAAADLAAAGQAPQGQEASRLSTLVAKGGALMTMGPDRRVASAEAQFDAKADTALFLGGVMVNQLRNVLQGKRLFIDRKAGTSRLESPAEDGQPAGRIAATFYQNEPAKAAPKAKPKAPAAAPDPLQSGTFGTFKADPNAPIDIEADTLDVSDQDKEAVFRGNVKSQQGDFIVRTIELSVFYSGQTGLGLTGAGANAGPADKSQAQLTRVEARQKVLIVSKDGQSASGDWAIFDLKANTVLLGDHVVISRGKDVAEGPRLKIDLTSGMYRFEVEPSAAGPQAPAVSASPPVAAPGAGSPVGRACPPGKQCLLFYPKEAQEKAAEAAKRILPDAAAKAKDGWQPGTSASPALRSN